MFQNFTFDFLNCPTFPKWLYHLNIPNTICRVAVFLNPCEYIYFYIATIITIIGLSFLTIYLDFKKNFLFSVGLSMIFGGALGNFIDRVFRGFVIDFITGKIFKKHLPVYNISDFCLLIGALLMLISFIGDLIL